MLCEFGLKEKSIVLDGQGRFQDIFKPRCFGKEVLSEKNFEGWVSIIWQVFVKSWRKKLKFWTDNDHRRRYRNQLDSTSYLRELEGMAQTQQLGHVVGRTLSAHKDLNLNIRTGGVWRHLRRAGAWSDLCKTKTVLMKGKWDRETGRTWTLIIINIYWASKTVLSISMLLVKKKILLASFCYWTVTAKSYTKCKQDGAIIPCFAGACSPRALCQTASVPPSSWQGRFHNMWKTVSACGSDGSREGREDHWIRDHSLSLDPLYVGYLEK